MSKTPTIAAIAAIAISLFAFWSTRATRQQTQNEFAALQIRLTELQQQVTNIGDQQHTLVSRAEQRSAKALDSNKTELKKSESRLDDRVSNQRKANDNQWQKIDALNAQHAYNKKLIDQINHDIVKMQREIRDLSRSTTSR